MSLQEHRVIRASESIHEALDNFFRAYKKSDQVVSVRCAVDHIKNTVKNCDLSDKALRDLVADHAILRGFNLHFDGGKDEGYGGPVHL